jgi:uncharacterized membrane protein SirB2
LLSVAVAEVVVSVVLILVCEVWIQMHRTMLQDEVAVRVVPVLFEVIDINVGVVVVAKAALDFLWSTSV